MRQPPKWWVILVVGATVALAVVTVRWADGEFVRVRSSLSSQPDQDGNFDSFYERVLHATPFVAANASLGMALLLTSAGRFRTRRGRLGPGAVRTLTVGIGGGLLTALLLLTTPPPFFNQGTAAVLILGWESTMPGLALGAWVATRRVGRRWRRDRLDRLARVVPWLWLGEPLLMATHGLLFG